MLMTRMSPSLLKMWQITTIILQTIILFITDGNPKPYAIGEVKGIGLKMLISVNIHQTTEECHGFSTSLQFSSFMILYLWRQI
jgi:hypothetical protein